MTTKYDLQLEDANLHFKAHPGYLPYIGKGYDTAKIKVLIVAESHYMPKEFNNVFSVADWYDNPELIYSRINKQWQRGWFNTRDVIKNYQAKQKNGAMMLFKNLEDAYKVAWPDKRLFDECAFINYFQRPAEQQGESIIISQRDADEALKNLLKLIDVIKPDKVIFVSSKAYKDFEKQSKVKGILREVLPYVGSVPHAGASVWWNKASKKFSLKGGEPVTGRQKFIRIVTPKNTTQAMPENSLELKE